MITNRRQAVRKALWMGVVLTAVMVLFGAPVSVLDLFPVGS